MTHESQYSKDLRALETKRCTACRGIGECSNAEDGGMICEYWTCAECSGTGYQPTEVQSAV